MIEVVSRNGWKWNADRFGTALTNSGVRRVAIIGTSLVQQCTYYHPTGIIGSQTRSWIDWASAIGKGACEIVEIHDATLYSGWGDRTFVGMNFGVSSQTLDEIIDRLPNVIANKDNFDIIIVDGGTNDVGSFTKEEIHAKRVRIANELLDIGKVVIMLPILARSTTSWPSGSAQRKNACWINQKTRDFCKGRDGLIFHDWNEDWVDFTSADGNPRTGFSGDGIHISARGAYYIGKGLWDRTLSKILPQGYKRVVSRDDQFDAIHNPYGVVNNNALMNGTTGTNGTGSTGTVATGYQVERNSGTTCTVVASKVANGTSEGDAQKLVFTLGGTANEVFYFRVNPNNISHSLAGKWVQPFATVKTNTAADTLQAIKLVCHDNTVSTIRSENFKESFEENSPFGPLYYPPVALGSYQIVGRPILLSPESTSARLRIEIFVNGAGSVAPDIEISQLGFRQIDAPEVVPPSV